MHWQIASRSNTRRNMTGVSLEGSSSAKEALVATAAPEGCHVARCHA